MRIFIIFIFTVMLFFIIGSCETGGAPEYVGTWLGDDIPDPGGAGTMDLILTINNDDTYAAMVYEDYTDPGTLQDGANSGTYTESGGNITLTVLLMYQCNDVCDWEDLSGMGVTMDISYTVNGDQMTLTGDFDSDTDIEDLGPLLRQ
jgi:hypothetical protein